MLLFAVHLKLSEMSKNRLRNTSEVAEVEGLGAQIRFNKVELPFFSDFEWISVHFERFFRCPR